MDFAYISLSSSETGKENIYYPLCIYVLLPIFLYNGKKNKNKNWPFFLSTKEAMDMSNKSDGCY